jgi:outer membrane protein assembly factor BamB
VNRGGHGRDLARRHGRLGALGLAVALGVRCAPLPGHDRILWELSTFERRPWHGFCSMAAPVVDAGVLFVAGGYFWDRDARVYSIDAGSGRVRWRSPGTGVYDGGLTVAGDLVLALEGGVLTAYARDTGARQWQQRGVGGIYGQRAVGHERVYLRDGDSIAAYDLATGAPRWRQRTDSPAITPPAIAGDVLYFGTRARTGWLTALDAHSGRRRGEPRHVSGFNGSITASAGRLLLSAGHEGRRVTYILDPSTDDLRLIPHGLVAVDGEVAFFESAPRTLMAWHVLDGRTLWSRAVSWDLGANQSIVGDQAVFVTGYERPPGLNTLRVFDLETGRLHWSFEAGDWLAGILATPDVVFVASEDCRVYAVRRRL